MDRNDTLLQRIRRHGGSALALAAYMALVFALSHQSRPPLPTVLLSVSDKLLHAAEYLPLGFLLARVVGAGSPADALVAWGAAVLFGASDEFHQSFVPGRDASVWDLAADAVGAGLGVWACRVWAALRARRESVAAG